jgi:hypothetical protein
VIEAQLLGAMRRVRAVGGRSEICGALPEVRRRLEPARVYRLGMRTSAMAGNDYA